MQITKFEHACVLVEDSDQNLNFLVDPGIYAWQSGNVDLSKLPQLDYVIVTHSHGDHMAEPFVKALVEKYPEAQWIAPSDAHEALKQFGVGQVTNQTIDKFVVVDGDHAKVVPFGVACKNLKVDYLDKLSIVGDTLDISESKEVLLLPIQAPWGTTVNALEVAIKLAPKHVVPIHDWMWNAEWKSNVYSRFESVLAEHGIKFIAIENGQPIDLN